MDEKGQELEFKQLQNGEHIFHFRNCYDEAGRTVFTENIDANGQALSRQMNSYQFNEDGNLIEKVSLEEISLDQFKSLYDYNTTGIKIKERDYYNGQLQKLEDFDEHGNATRYILYKLDGTVNSEMLTSFDAQGNLLNSTQYEDGALRRRSKHRYLTDGTIEEEIFDARTMQTSITRFENNSKSNSHSIKTFVEGKLVHENSSSYNEETKVRENKMLTSNGCRYETTEQLEFDHYGNFLKMIMTIKDPNGISFSIIEKSHDGLTRRFVKRSIDYYS